MRARRLIVLWLPSRRGRTMNVSCCINCFFARTETEMIVFSAIWCIAIRASMDAILQLKRVSLHVSHFCVHISHDNNDTRCHDAAIALVVQSLSRFINSDNDITVELGRTHIKVKLMLHNILHSATAAFHFLFLCSPIAATPVHYQIASGNTGGAFGIHNTTGLIYIALALDYEKIKKVSELFTVVWSAFSRWFAVSSHVDNFQLLSFSLLSLQYELRVTASDNFKENYTTVVINVKDVNDNSPIFEKTSYRTQITEEDDRALPKRVLKVSWRVSLCSWKAWDCMMMTLCSCCCCEMACLHRSTLACW